MGKSSPFYIFNISHATAYSVLHGVLENKNMLQFSQKFGNDKLFCLKQSVAINTIKNILTPLCQYEYSVISRLVTRVIKIKPSLYPYHVCCVQM